MSELEKAARMALEALEILTWAVSHPDNVKVGEDAQAALRQALEQPAQRLSGLDVYLDPNDGLKPKRHYPQPAQQEPVAWATQLGEYAHLHWGAKRPEYPMVYEIPLYTRPQAREPLTDEEIMTYRHMIDWTAEWSYINFARAIEAAHNITGEKK